MRRRIRSGEAMEVSSGNVFADLDLPDAAEFDTKVRLAVAINRLLAAHRLTHRPPNAHPDGYGSRLFDRARIRASA
jgi:hypothetical protein